MYPQNYFFAVTRDGIDRRHSLLTNPGRPRVVDQGPRAPGPCSSPAPVPPRETTATEATPASCVDCLPERLDEVYPDTEMNGGCGVNELGADAHEKEDFEARLA